MKKIKKPIVAAGVLGVVGIVGLASVGVANAIASPQDHFGHMSGLVDKIATQFNLDKAKVQEVFDEQKTIHHENHKNMMMQKLQQLVNKGAITASQKTAIETKLNELQQQHNALRDSLKGLTPEQRKEKMDQKHQELQDWAKQQGIDLSIIKGVFPALGTYKGHHGNGHGLGDHTQ